MEYVALREIPPVVYVPIGGEESEGRAQIELRRLQTGQLAITAFSDWFYDVSETLSHSG